MEFFDNKNITYQIRGLSSKKLDNCDASICPYFIICSKSKTYCEHPEYYRLGNNDKTKEE